ncbi:WXG100 family type VII secretion target [Allokutzneria albata]|uniref:ESAT-6-like protein n=1 Tax=Allokutzneria albata TaxID=211114 RepID=A0A1G9YWX6_ALLAB|nr:WXG100 family type VII secretion target [Allokutzneria albata]SDN13669.1 WXG100 family type VII secretion target [Allokutzneria albata]
MTQYEVNAEAMGKASVDVARVRDQLVGQLNSLRGQLEPLQGQWKGEASKAFQTLMRSWGEQTLKLNNALGVISDQLGQSGKSYIRREQQATEGMSSIRAGLEGL